MNIGPLFRRRNGPRLLVQQRVTAAEIPPPSNEWDDVRYQRGWITSDVAVNLLVTTLAAATIVLRAPVFTQPAPQVRVPEAPTANLLLTTLAPQAQQPFAQFDWPAPKYAPWIQETLFPNVVISAPAVQAPFGPYEWPAAKRLNQAAETLFPNVALAFQVAAQVPSIAPFDWPRPKHLPWVAETTYQNLLVFVQPLDRPFGPYDWPTPRLIPTVRVDPHTNLAVTIPAPVVNLRGAVLTPPGKWKQQPETLYPNTLVFVAVAAQQPFGPYDWQAKYPQVRGPETLYPNLAATVLAPLVAPFGPYDWRAIYSPIRIVDVVYPNLAVLAPVGQKPFAQYDWSLPKPVVRVPEFVQQNTLPTLLDPQVQAQLPFNQYDWPKPQHPPHTDWWFSQNLTISLPEPPPPVAPFLQVMATTGVSQNLYTLTPHPDGHYILTINPAVGS